MKDIFVKAKPIWGSGLEEEKNITLGLYKKVTAKTGKAVLAVATSGFYKVFLNGKFLFFGPARCAHGYYRADEIAIDLKEGDNHIAIQVVNYFINSFYLPCQRGFIQAELTENGVLLAATGVDTNDFKLVQLNERIKKIQRYSYQRPFAEAYNLTEDFSGWYCGKFGTNVSKIKTVLTEEKNILKRNIPLNKFTESYPEFKVGHGTVIGGQKPEVYKKDRSLKYINDPERGNLQGFYENELDVHLSDEIQEFSSRKFFKEKNSYEGMTELKGESFEILSFPCEKTGFITADIECSLEGTLYFMVDEILDADGDVDPLRMECCNAVKLNFEKGSYRFMSAEPMGFKYIKILCSKGEFLIKDIHITETVCPQPILNNYQSKDTDLNKILNAARETFIQNSFDIFTDCPTRERAGWLCDSYFLGRSEYEFTGSNLIERNFLENYMLPESFENIPYGMVPMCYPADQGKRGFIPNWAMWLILELEDYAKRSEDVELIISFKSKIYKLLSWFSKYENSDGLLERLSGWVFVEWSKANDFTQDINFPSNMLYARALEGVSNLYSDAGLLKKADKLKETIRNRAFDGEFFIDNEVYKDGAPVKTENRTETCQYYAFFTGVATPKLYPELWSKLKNEFGPDRKKSGLYQEIYPSNAFIGNFLRLSLLEQNGIYGQLLREIKGYFLYMAETTGTLWEHIDTHASCNHGFASYVAYLIRMAEQGLEE